MLGSKVRVKICCVGEWSCQQRALEPDSHRAEYGSERVAAASRENCQLLEIFRGVKAENVAKLLIFTQQHFTA